MRCVQHTNDNSHRYPWQAVVGFDSRQTHTQRDSGLAVCSPSAYSLRLFRASDSLPLRALFGPCNWRIDRISRDSSSFHYWSATHSSHCTFHLFIALFHQLLAVPLSLHLSLCSRSSLALPLRASASHLISAYLLMLFLSIKIMLSFSHYGYRVMGRGCLLQLAPHLAKWLW